VLLHDTGAGLFEKASSDLLTINEPHPEGPARILNTLSILKRGLISTNIVWKWGRLAKKQEIQYFHTKEYIDSIIKADESGPVWLTETTVVGNGSYHAFKAAVGTTLSAMDYVLKEDNRIAYALIRPCGHHASREVADGYCIFNNVAIAAEFAIKRGAKRVAIIDWDVHHGNGTQTGFYDRNDVLTISLHMDHGAWGKSHTETGKVDEVGEGKGTGYNFNIPLPFGTGDEGYNYAIDKVVVPKIKSYKPDTIIIACGQDASQFDADGRQLLTMNGFRLMGQKMRDLADTFTNSSMLIVQEGGYALSYAPYCLYATLEGVLKSQDILKDPLAFIPENIFFAKEKVNEIRKSLKNFF
jgi:acetoin utilization deacetylase AcuC-like enzyme